MLKLHVLQADYGDCLLLEYGQADASRYILIDGGPSSRIYENYLRPSLAEIAGAGGRLELVLLSHVDNDHVTGLLDLLAEVRAARDAGSAPLIEIGGLWHNSFTETIGQGNDLETRMANVMNQAAGQNMTNAVGGTDFTVQGIAEGNRLRREALLLAIPLNAQVPNRVVMTDNLPDPVDFDGLRIQVIGPSEKNLDRLREEWVEWLQAQEEAVAAADPETAAKVDRSIPNLSSIMILAEDGHKRMLLTGDGLADDALEGLAAAGLLDDDGKMHLDVFKLPHHGSSRNLSRRFLSAVTADKYVISANGRYSNPDLAALIWLVEAIRDSGRPAEILVTNATSATQQLCEEYDPAAYGFTLTLLQEGESKFVV